MFLWWRSGRTGLVTLTDHQILLRIDKLVFIPRIRVELVTGGLSFHLPRGYICFAMALALAASVEAFNVLAASRRGEGRERAR